MTNEYFTTGLLKKKYGSRLYPVEYTYDTQGRMLTMKTWKNFSANSGTAITTWAYDQYRGWLTGKTYDGGAAGPSYTYTPAGRLASRLWARGTNATYLYNLAGDLSTTFYSDPATPGITNAFDRRGRVIGVTNGASICALNLGDPGQLLGESWLAGPLSGLTVSNVYDSVLRRTTNGLWNGTSWLTQTRFGYDAASRLWTVSDGTNTAGYSYVANSPLVSEIGFTNGSTRRMVSTKGYDYLNRLTNIASTAGATTVASFTYKYNDADQRTAVTNADGSYIVYSYDGLGQVTAGNKYWSDGTAVAGQQFTYNFDDIGNRTAAAFGGDETGANLRSATYGANSLNQYTNRTVPGYVNVIGSANSNATVSIWGSDGSYSATSRKGNYFRGELAVDNTTNAPWLTVTNVAVMPNSSSPDIVTNTIGNVFLPQTPESFAYDVDGNLTVDGRWTNVWNGENRLIGMTCKSNAASDSKLRLTFGYDYQGRRISKQVETWSGSSWSVTLSNKFLYDGWNMIAELNGTNNAVIRSYMWGTDLSGTLQGFGGVGGLLAENDAAQGVHFVEFDGNGNVAGLVKATDGTISANYEYGPFGEVVKSSGVVGRSNPVRFSTKYQDDETDLVYYGYRYYRPNSGAWLGKDPIGERGGLNLLGFVDNNSLSRFDVVGLAGLPFPAPAPSFPPPGAVPFPGPTQPITILPQPGPPPNNIIPLPTPEPVVPPSVIPRILPIASRACAVAATAYGGYKLGQYLDENSGYLYSTYWGDVLGDAVSPPLIWGGGASGTHPGSPLPAGSRDPLMLPIVNPGKCGCGACKPCPPNSPAWEINEPGHGGIKTHWHWIEYNQVPATYNPKPGSKTRPCDCIPTRMTSATKPPGA